ncbi:MAG: DinB family protein [Candidatus Nanopelagicales bacterium]
MAEIAHTADHLLHYLARLREDVIWKLAGLGEYDLRRPLTPTGSNVLGLVAHLAFVEIGYFGEVVGRSTGIPSPWDDPDADPNTDLWVSADTSSAEVIALYRQAGEHTAQVVRELGLEGPGYVSWWRAEAGEGAGCAVDVGRLLVHVTVETARHAGQIDILREQLDGRAGLSQQATNLPTGYDWAAHVERVKRRLGPPVAGQGANRGSEDAMGAPPNAAQAISRPSSPLVGIQRCRRSRQARDPVRHQRKNPPRRSNRPTATSASAARGASVTVPAGGRNSPSACGIIKQWQLESGPPARPPARPPSCGRPIPDLLIGGFLLAALGPPSSCGRPISTPPRSG